MKSKVDGHNNLYKDDKTGVITNRETSERQRYRLAKQQALMNLSSQGEIAELKKELKDLSSLRDEMDEIKGLLHQLLNK